MIPFSSFLFYFAYFSHACFLYFKSSHLQHTMVLLFAFLISKCVYLLGRIKSAEEVPLPFLRSPALPNFFQHLSNSLFFLYQFLSLLNLYITWIKDIRDTKPYKYPFSYPFFPFSFSILNLISYTDPHLDTNSQTSFSIKQKKK